MLFTEALKALTEGKFAARTEWECNGEYVVLLPGMPYLWKIMTQPNPNAGNWLPLLADLEANDWNVVDNAKREIVQINDTVIDVVDAPIAA